MLAPAAPRAAADPASLTLGECVREALAANPNVGAAGARAAAARAAARAAAAVRQPRVDLTSAYSYSERAQRLVPASSAGEAGLFDEDLAEATLEIRMPLYAGGSLAARARAAALSVAAVELAQAGLLQDLVLDVAAAYLAAVAQRAAIESVAGALAALDGQLAVALAMEEVGRIAPLDRLKVEVRAAAVRQRLSQARRDRELVLHHLASLLGRGPGAEPVEVDRSPAGISVDGVPEQLVAEALATRPDVASARVEVQRAQALLASVRGERWPGVDGFARYTARTLVPPRGDGQPGHEEYGSAGIGLRLPLWTGGLLAARIAEAEARLAEAEARARAVELQVTEDVRRAAAAFAEARERKDVAARALDQAAAAFAIETDNYELGRSPINDVLDAQAALLEAELAQAQASHDLALAGMALSRAAGRDLAALLMSVGEDSR